MVKHNCSYLSLINNRVDNGIYVLIELINRLGVRTRFSCENINQKNKIQIMVCHEDFKRFEEIIEDTPFTYNNMYYGKNYKFSCRYYFRLMNKVLVEFNKKGSSDFHVREIKIDDLFIIK